MVAGVSDVGPSAENGGVTQVIEPKPVGNVIPRANVLPKLPGLFLWFQLNERSGSSLFAAQVISSYTFFACCAVIDAFIMF